jgi:hypothetical protein
MATLQRARSSWRQLTGVWGGQPPGWASARKKLTYEPAIRRHQTLDCSPQGCRNWRNMQRGFVPSRGSLSWIKSAFICKRTMDACPPIFVCCRCRPSCPELNPVKGFGRLLIAPTAKRLYDNLRGLEDHLIAIARELPDPVKVRSLIHGWRQDPASAGALN